VNTPQSHFIFFVQSKAVFPLAKFDRETNGSSLTPQKSLTCLDYLGRKNTNISIYVSVIVPKVAKAKRGLAKTSMVFSSDGTKIFANVY
jgi:hypothetical protein